MTGELLFPVAAAVSVLTTGFPVRHSAVVGSRAGELPRWARCRSGMFVTASRWLAFVLASSLAYSLPARACDCLASPPTAEVGLAQSGLVVLGYVQSVTPAEAAGAARGSNRRVTVAVERVLAGAAGPVIDLSWDGSLCTQAVAPGDRALVYVAAGSDGRLQQVAGCDGASRIVTGAAVDAEVAGLERHLQQSVAGVPLLEAVEVRLDRVAPRLDSGVRPGAGGR